MRPCVYCDFHGLVVLVCPVLLRWSWFGCSIVPQFCCGFQCLVVLKYPRVAVLFVVLLFSRVPVVVVVVAAVLVVVVRVPFELCVVVLCTFAFSSSFSSSVPIVTPHQTMRVRVIVLIRHLCVSVGHTCELTQQ